MHSIVMRAKLARRSASSAWAEPKISRTSLNRSLLSFLAAIAAIAFIGRPLECGPRCLNNPHVWKGC